MTSVRSTVVKCYVSDEHETGVRCVGHRQAVCKRTKWVTVLGDDLFDGSAIWLKKPSRQMSGSGAFEYRGVSNETLGIGRQGRLYLEQRAHMATNLNLLQAKWCKV